MTIPSAMNNNGGHYKGHEACLLMDLCTHWKYGCTKNGNVRNVRSPRNEKILCKMVKRRNNSNRICLTDSLLYQRSLL